VNAAKQLSIAGAGGIDVVVAAMRRHADAAGVQDYGTSPRTTLTSLALAVSSWRLVQCDATLMQLVYKIKAALSSRNSLWALDTRHFWWGYWCWVVVSAMQCRCDKCWCAARARLRALEVLVGNAAIKSLIVSWGGAMRRCCSEENEANEREWEME
jgi:hypothetical protein